MSDRWEKKNKKVFGPWVYELWASLVKECDHDGFGKDTILYGMETLSI